MNLAIVDIGSNAVKYKIFSSKDNKLTEYVREPLRLGTDVFKNGFLTKPSKDKLINLLCSFRNQFHDKGILNYRFIATSALRDASNNDEIQQELLSHGINLEIISGDTEAELLANYPTNNKSYAVVDIGGGSLEIYVNDGIHSSYSSFQLGAVRLLHEDPTKSNFEKDRLSKWLKNFSEIEILYGLGGNLRCILEVGNCSKKIKISEYVELLNKYNQLDSEVLINNFLIPSDRVDIVPLAGELYHLIAKALKVKYIKSSFWSISNGLMEKIIQN